MLRVSIAIDPYDPDPEAVAEYFAAVLRRLDERPEEMRIAISSPRGVWMDVDPADGAHVFRVDGRGEARRHFRRRWIADHAVPFAMWRGPFGRTTLVVRPVEANRVRVRETVLSRVAWRLVAAVERFRGAK